MFIELTTEVGQFENRMFMIRVQDIKSVIELSEVYTPRCEILTYSNEVYKVKESYSDIKEQIEEALNTYKI
ncbi:hypothetical protein B4089_3742 [Bacillus licheniformis]|nr:hypothetical protein B4089_3597 [Bacillus licheniformis]OLF87272.1 hypothetical protein B4089_3742 [Bacillus licheniformis]